MANPKKWLIQNIVPSPGRLLPLFAPPRHWHTKSYWVEEVGSIVPLLATFSCLSYFLQVFVSHTAPTRHGPRQTNGWSSQRWRKRLRSEMGHVVRKPKAVLQRWRESLKYVTHAQLWHCDTVCLGMAETMYSTVHTEDFFRSGSKCRSISYFYSCMKPQPTKC